MVGDKTGLYIDSKLPERIAWPIGNRFEFEKKVSVDLYMQGDATYFIVRGVSTIDEYIDERYFGEKVNVKCYTIDCLSWDIFGKINTSNSLRSIFPKKYLNIYDYKWFDNLRDRFFGYLDGSTGF